MEKILQISAAYLVEQEAFSTDRETIKLYNSTFVKGKMIFPLREKDKALKYCQDKSTHDNLIYLIVENVSDFTIWLQKTSKDDISSSNLNDVDRKERYELDALLETCIGDLL